MVEVVGAVVDEVVMTWPRLWRSQWCDQIDGRGRNGRVGGVDMVDIVVVVIIVIEIVVGAMEVVVVAMPNGRGDRGPSSGRGRPDRSGRKAVWPWPEHPRTK